MKIEYSKKHNDFPWNENLDYSSIRKKEYAVNNRNLKNINNKRGSNLNGNTNNRYRENKENQLNQSGRDIHSLIQNITPEALKSSILSSNGAFDFSKKPQISILKKNRNNKEAHSLNQKGINLRKSNNRCEGNARRRVKFEEMPTVHCVENWKFLNVDMSKEGRRYIRYIMKKRRMAAKKRCSVF